MQDAATTPTETKVAALSAEVRQQLEHVIETGQIELPVLPEVASQLITMSMDENCDLRRLTTLINRDQSMTAHLLRLANSALYSPPVPIVSLQQALNRLGLAKIRQIAVMISCESKVFQVAGFGLAVRNQFRHSIAVGAYANDIARQRRWNLEEAFLCGLLHDVGKPVLLQAICDLRDRLDIQVERAAIEAAAAEFHCRVGAVLVRKWGLPESLAETILYHHEPEGAPNVLNEARMTRLADDFAHFALGTKKIGEDDLRKHPMNEPLNVYPDETERLIGQREMILAMADSLS